MHSPGITKKRKLKESSNAFSCGLLQEAKDHVLRYRIYTIYNCFFCIIRLVLRTIKNLSFGHSEKFYNLDYFMR